MFASITSICITLELVASKESFDVKKTKLVEEILKQAGLIDSYDELLGDERLLPGIVTISKLESVINNFEVLVGFDIAKIGPVIVGELEGTRQIINYTISEESENQIIWEYKRLREADIILDEMMTKMGYFGSNLGERLKQVEKSDFITIENAWEAHKIRNMIAHEGSDFILTNRKAREVIDLYSKVFKEFRFI